MRNLKLTCIKPFLWDATKAVSEIEDGENVQGTVIIIFKTGQVLAAPACDLVFIQHEYMNIHPSPN